MCTISIQSVTGILSGGVLSAIEIAGSLTSDCRCDILSISVKCDKGSLSPIAVPIVNGGFSAIFNNSAELKDGECLCNSPVYVNVTCGSQTTTLGPLIINCTPRPACPLLDITYQPTTICPGDQFTFTVVNNSGSNVMGVVIDFQDGSTQTVNLGSIPIFNTVQINHIYAANGNYNVTVTIPGCPPQTIPIVVDCGEQDCCPKITDVQVVVHEDCLEGCNRDVEIRTFFEPRTPGCDLAVMHWELYAGGNTTPFATSPPIMNNQASPHINHFLLSSSQSPVTARLIIDNPTGCQQILERTIIIPECHTPPSCPVISNFSVVAILDCVAIGNACSRIAKFRLDAFFDLGCGSNNTAEIAVNFGDNSNNAIETITITNAGNQTHYFDHEYFQPGTYTVMLSVISPEGCKVKTLQITIPDCGLGNPVCPEISILSVELADSCQNCTKEVELKLRLKNPDACLRPATFHIEWGDGDRHPNNSSLTVPNSPYDAIFSHAYAAGQYTIRIVVDDPQSCGDITYVVDIPTCDDCEPPCNEGCLMSILCPIFQVMAISGLALGIIWYILSTCTVIGGLFSPQAALVFIGVGLLGLILYWTLCKCKPCGWFWLFLWKLFLGVGLMLMIFGDCCSFVWYGLIMVAVSFIFFFLWKNKCNSTICKIAKELAKMWATAMLPAYSLLVAIPGFGTLCLLNWIFISLTSLFAVITLYAFSCKD